MEQTYFNLTIPQQNIWNLQKYYADTAVSTLCGAVFYRDKRRDDVLANAINQVVCSQTGLRLRFSETNGYPRQYIEDYTYMDIPVRTFSSWPDFESYAASCASSPIGPADTAMCRFEIVHVESFTGVLVILSHLISDAWTFSLVGKGFDDAYKRLEAGQGGECKAYDYRDYASSEEAYLASARYEKDQKFWLETYRAKPDVTAIRAGSAAPASIAARRFCKTLDAGLAKDINRFCAEHAISEAVLFETALGIYLARINPENRSVTMGVPVLNRRNAQEKNTMGMFISTLPLTIGVSPDDTAIQLANRIAAGHGNLFRHQKYPYSRLIEYIRTAHDFPGSLYEVMISYQNAQIDSSSFTKWFSNGYSEVPLVLHIDNRDMNDSYTITIDYQTAVFRQDEEISLIADRIEYILRQIITDGEIQIRGISILPEPERRRLALDFNNTAADYPKDLCIHERFMAQAQKTPDRTALIFERNQFSYQKLDEMSNSLAFLLRAHGIGAGDIVPIIARRSWHIIVAMLGVLKTGAAYMPVSPDYPRNRIASMVTTAQTRLALQYGYEETLDVETWDLGSVDYSRHICPVPNQNRPEDLCYIIFTSGSTGEPKGICLRHQSVANYAQAHPHNPVCQELVTKGYRRIVSVTNIIFDIFVTESLLPLLHGMTVCFASENEIYLQSRLNQLIIRNQIEVMQTTPTKMRSYLEDRHHLDYLKSLKCIILGGEALPRDLFEKLKLHTDADVFNIYGPAETTVWSSNKKVSCASDITIGRPIANTQIYIVDEKQRLLPAGIAGELCIAGDGVAKGYLGRPELTKERFTANPFATNENKHGTTLYHTGDLACRNADGELTYLGRIDAQVKIRGLRVELEEIESAINSFPGIRIAAAAEQRDSQKRQYLAGYYVAEQAADEKKLRKYLSQRLPGYMIPNYFVRLSEMPLTASGKTDRKSLPVPKTDGETGKAAEYTAPETETEKIVSDIWKHTLSVSRAGKQDDFWELGGDSLLAIKILNQLEARFHVELSVRDIMENPSLEQLAALIEQAEPSLSPPIAAHGRDHYRLLPQQKAIYAACSRDPESLIYNMPARIRLPMDIDRAKLKQSILAAAKRHQAFRIRIASEDDELYGIYDDTAQLTFEEYTNATENAFLRAFDLTKAPLAHVGFTDDALLFDIHHIIADGESLYVILQEIQYAYEHGGEIEESRAGSESVEYSDYSDYFWKMDFSRHKEYFKRALVCDWEPAALPEPGQDCNDNRASNIYCLPESAKAAARDYVHHMGLTETMVFLGAYGILLAKYTGKTEILTSVILTNRKHREVQKTIGMFVNTLPIHMRVNGATSAYFYQIKQTLSNLFEYQELPFSEIADCIGMKDKSVINTSFVYQGNGGKRLVLEGNILEAEFIDTHTSKFDLTMEVTPSETDYIVRLEYNPVRFGNALMERLFNAYVQILSHLTADTIRDIRVLSDAEQMQQLTGLNATVAAHPESLCAHEQFRKLTAKAPENVGLIFEDKVFTYKQLDKLSDSLAHFLYKRGIKRNDVVPIIAKRSWHVIVAMLGILKAGAAYMTVDYQYPLQRIRHLIRECRASLVLTFGYGYPDAVPLESLPFVEDAEPEPLENQNSMDDLFCVIHTSGSTGAPKVTALTHANIVHFIRYSRELFRGTRQAIAATIITFDAFIQETIAALCNQLPVILLNESQITNQLEFENIVSSYEDSFLFQTPTKLLNYIKNSKTAGFVKKVSTLAIGGEVFPDELYQRIRRLNCACQIFNGYGPTETTIFAAVKPLTDSGHITIGKPIMNTQIYILDKNQSLLPIGVPGELCIAGDGVGKGYLNQPELTASRFLPNPFATKENRHGPVMYRTGDLACWTEDGEIRYLGRIDTQVKIRGLRIELGEIESAMATVSGIRLTAAAEKRDSSGRQYLVGYYVTNTEIEQQELRQQLSLTLPRYMIPHFFMRLEQMPMTPSGKIDRKNLPSPDFSLPKTDYTAPRTEQERILCKALSDVLGVEPIGIEDDFFEMGGDSLKAIEFTAKAHQAGIHLALQQIFDYPSVKQLCECIEKGTADSPAYTAADFASFKPLLQQNVIREPLILKQRPLGNVLLTGATGFLGAHILDALMKKETGVIYCLVRGSGSEHAGKRLSERLRYYFGDIYEKEIGRRLIPIAGDIEQETFRDGCPADVQTVIHAAASVKHYGSYEYFYKANVLGTQHVAAFARAAGARLIHISTLSVSGNSMADEFSGYRSDEEIQFDETSFSVGQPLDNVYIRSKFEAEHAVFRSMSAGLDAKIIRVGNLTNRAFDYKFQPNYKQNAFLTRLKALLEFGLFPDYLLPLYSEFSPVDLTAEGVVRIAMYSDSQCVFHLNSNRPVYFNRLMELLQELKIPMKVVDGAVFDRKLRETMRKAETEYIFEALQNDIAPNGSLIYDSNIHIKNDVTMWFLQHTGFQWNEIDDAYIRGYIHYFCSLGYLEVRHEK